MKITFSVLLFFIIGAISAQTSIKLNVSEGDEFSQTTVIKSTVKQSMQGQTMETISENTVTVNYKILEVNGEMLKVEAAYDRIAVNISAMGQNTTIDSDEPSEDPQMGLIKSMVDKPFIINMTNTGDVQSVDGLDELFKVEEGDSEETATGKQSMQQLFGGDKFAEQLEAGFAVYTDKMVSKGDSWSHQSSQSMGGVVTEMDYTYTYDGMDNNVHNIQIGGDVKVSIDDKENPMLYGATMTNDKGVLSGMIKLDPKTNWVQTAETTTEITSEMKMQGMTIPMETIIVTTVK